jgi:predicted metal-dependent RNase
MEVSLQQKRWTDVADAELFSKVQSFISPLCGFFRLARDSEQSGRWRIYLRHNKPAVKVKHIATVCGFKQLEVRVEKEELIKRTYRSSVKYGTMIGYGGCEEVGRSSFYFELSGLRILVDCGASFGSNPYPAIPKSQIRALDYVFISHAHLDHSALIPWLYKHGCKAQLIATEPTFAISKVLCEDYLYVQTQILEHPPAYEKEFIDWTFNAGCAVAYDHRYQIGENVFFTFINSGHVLGSAMILFEDDDQRTLYSGDIYFGNGSRILTNATLPERIDHLIMETTYGGKQHEHREATEARFFKSIVDTLEGGGTVIIPSFALGRAQEVLMLLDEHPISRQYPIYVDGMIVTMNDIYKTYAESDKPLGFRIENTGRGVFAYAPFFEEIFDRHKVRRDKNPKIIVTTSGMCEGLAAAYLSRYIEDPKNLLLFVGYQSQQSLGGQLSRGAKFVLINGSIYPVNIQIVSAGLSAHSAAADILSALEHNPLQNLVTVHGSASSMDSFIEAAKKTLSVDQIIKIKTGQEIVLYC